MPDRDFPEFADDDILTPDKAKEEQRIAEPPKYAVVMMNDDFTPMDFVVELLMKFFSHSSESAALIMFDVHKKGKGIAGVYPQDIAETKSAIVNDYCQSEGHPFTTSVEQA